MFGRWGRRLVFFGAGLLFFLFFFSVFFRGSPVRKFLCFLNVWMSLLGCPWKLGTIVSKLVYNLLKGLTAYLCRGSNPFDKYHAYHASFLERDTI